MTWADGGYAGKLVTWVAGMLHRTVQIVRRPGNPHAFQVLPRRRVVERTFGWIMKYRRCVRDCERLPEHHETYLYWSMITIVGRRVARRHKPAARPRLPCPWQHEVPNQAEGLKPVPALPFRGWRTGRGRRLPGWGTMPADRAILFRLATSARLESAVRAAPPGERLAWRAASRYVAGTTAVAAARVAQELRDRGVGSSIDQFGELVRDTATAERVAASYLGLADQVNALPADTWLSIDLSHLGLDVDPPGCADRLAAIAARLSAGRRIQVGAEDYSRADAVLACVEAVARQGLAGRLGATAQANFRRTPRDLERLVEAGVYVRLVKGAYVEAHDRALPYGEPTDIAYLRLAHQLAQTRAQFALATTTASCARPCSLPSVCGPSSNCSESAPRSWTTSSPAASPSACRWRWIHRRRRRADPVAGQGVRRPVLQSDQQPRRPGLVRNGALSLGVGVVGQHC